MKNGRIGIPCRSLGNCGFHANKIPAIVFISSSAQKTRILSLSRVIRTKLCGARSHCKFMFFFLYATLMLSNIACANTHRLFSHTVSVSSSLLLSTCCHRFQPKASVWNFTILYVFTFSLQSLITNSLKRRMCVCLVCAFCPFFVCHFQSMPGIVWNVHCFTQFSFQWKSCRSDVTLMTKPNHDDVVRKHFSRLFTSTQ